MIKELNYLKNINKTLVMIDSKFKNLTHYYQIEHIHL